MATLVAAFGSSHSPALNSPPEDTAGHARRDEMYAHHLDRDGRRTDYRSLLAAAPPSLAGEIAPERIAARIGACQAALARLAGSIVAARLEALVVVGDDQREQYLDDNLPAFLVYCGETIVNGVLDLPGEAPEYWRRARSQYHEPERPREYPVAAALARHLAGSLVAQEFDVAHGASLPRARGRGTPSVSCTGGCSPSRRCPSCRWSSTPTIRPISRGRDVATRSGAPSPGQLPLFRKNNASA
jgi:hypothetical protein